MITSLDNKKVKEVCKLKAKKGRDETNTFIVEGIHLIEEAYKNNSLLYTFGIKEYNYPNFELVTEQVMKKMTSLDTIPSIIGVCKFTDEKEINGNVIILDNVQNPGNLGTIIRSAVAFNIDTVVLSTDTVDVYNEKVLRSTEGMIFNTNVITRDLMTFIPMLKSMGYTIYGTDVVSGIDVKNVETNGKYAIIMGSEGKGVSPLVKEFVDKNIYINMNNKCESLNVGVSASIILYELDKKRYDKNR